LDRSAERVVAAQVRRRSKGRLRFLVERVRRVALSLPSRDCRAHRQVHSKALSRVGRGSQGPRAAGDVQPQDDRGSDPDEDEKEEEEKDEPAGEESEKPQDESERRDARRKAWHRGVRSWLMCGPGALGFMDFLNFTVG
jgi:hypothetical protein